MKCPFCEQTFETSGKLFRVLDWSKTTKELSIALGISPLAVTSARKRHAPETMGNMSAHCQKIQAKTWGETDWSKSNVEIGSLLGVSQITVSMARQKYAPKTSRAFASRKYDWTKTDWSKPTREIVKESGATRHAVIHARRAHASGRI